MSALLTERLDTKASKLAGQQEHAAALIRALGNPSEWSFTGSVVDLGAPVGACACGHEIRYCFLIAHPSRGQAHVGSTCINHLQSISPALGDQLAAARDALEQRITDAQRAAKRAQADSENAALWITYQAARIMAQAAHARNRAARIRSPRELWLFCEGWREKLNVGHCPEYTRAGDLKKWLTKAIKRAKGVLA